MNRSQSGEILLIDACARTQSRTRSLAEYLLGRLGEPAWRERLSETPFPVADQAFLALRDDLVARKEFDHPLFAAARRFRSADTIVVAAPCWDLSFPASLKQYFEQINVPGVVFSYSPEGIPLSLCRAKALYYVTTAGGPIASDEYGYGYVKALAEGFYHIPRICLVKAEGLDIWGADVENILSRARADIDRLPLPTE